MRPHLTDTEIAEITDPLVSPAAQCRALRRMGFTVKQKPNGRPLVSRAHFEAVMAGAPVAPDQAGDDSEAEAQALIEHFRKGAQYARGKEKKKQPDGAAGSDVLETRPRLVRSP